MPRIKSQALWWYLQNRYCLLTCTMSCSIMTLSSVLPEPCAQGLPARITPSALSCSFLFPRDHLRNICLGHPVLQSKKVSQEVSGRAPSRQGAGGSPGRRRTLVPLVSVPGLRGDSFHVFSSVASCYFWRGNPEELLIAAWMKNKPLCLSPQDKHFQHQMKMRAPEVPIPCLCPSTHKQDILSSSASGGISQSRFPPCVQTASHLACTKHLSAIWDFSNLYLSTHCPSPWAPCCTEGSHPPGAGGPGVTSLLLTPCRCAHLPLLWGSSSLPPLPLGSVFPTDHAKKSARIPRWLWPARRVALGFLSVMGVVQLCVSLIFYGSWSPLPAGNLSEASMLCSSLLVGLNWGVSAAGSAGIPLVSGMLSFPD